MNGTEAWAWSQLITGGILATLAIGVAFGPELLRSWARRRTEDVPDALPGDRTTA